MSDQFNSAKVVIWRLTDPWEAAHSKHSKGRIRDLAN